MKRGSIDMFSKILGNTKNVKDDAINEKLVEKISKMDLSEMRLYVNAKLTDFPVCEFGLAQIMKKLTLVNENTSNMYLKNDDMDSKKKKAFDLIILILKHNKVSINIIEIIQQFLNIYDEIIKQYDKDNKQIYESMIKDQISTATDKIDFKSDMAEKMRTLS